MAKCGCVDRCNCVFQSGTCTKVNITSASGGCGPATLTYSIDIVTDDQTVFCGPNGLEALLHTTDTNTVHLTGDGSGGAPLEANVILTPNGNVPNPDGISPNPGNLIKLGPTGIYVSCEDIQDCIGSAIDVNTSDCLDYNDATNTISIKICAAPNGLQCLPAGSPGCATGGLAVIPSSDAGNSLGFGGDGKLFTAGSAIAPGACETFTGSGTSADPFVISPQVAPELNGLECVPGQGLLVTPSSDPNNNLVFGGDGNLYVNKCPLTIAGSQVLTGNPGPCFEFTGGGCGVPMEATLRLSADICQGLTCGNDGLYVQVDQTELPAPATITVNFGPFGPFNGVNQAGTTLLPSTCITITNPSPCRSMVVAGSSFIVADTGRTRGAFRFTMDVDEFGCNFCAGSGSVFQAGQHDPNPSSRFITSGAWNGNDFTIGPGGSHSECFRLSYFAPDPGQPAVNARIFGGQLTFTLEGRWAR